MCVCVCVLPVCVCVCVLPVYEVGGDEAVWMPGGRPADLQLLGPHCCDLGGGQGPGGGLQRLGDHARPGPAARWGPTHTLSTEQHRETTAQSTQPALAFLLL